MIAMGLGVLLVPRKPSMGVERVGVHDDFFELGGGSIQGAMLLNRPRRALNEVLSTATIFEVPTIAAVHRNRHSPDTVARLCGAEAPNGAEGGTWAGGGRPDCFRAGGLREAGHAEFRRLREGRV